MLDKKAVLKQYFGHSSFSNIDICGEKTVEFVARAIDVYTKMEV